MKGIGIDIVEVSRLAKRLENKTFLNLVFTAQEQTECLGKPNRAECLAARFAAKEAYMKSIGIGWSTHAQFHEIEVVKTDAGQPQLRLLSSAEAYFKASGYTGTLLTLSHTKQTAVAVVIAL